MADAPKLEHKPPPAVLPQQAQAQKNVGRAKRTPEDQAEYFYNQKNMHRLMFFSSFFLLFSLVLMFVDDYKGVTPIKNRDWKDFQIAFGSMELTRLQFDIAAAEKILADNADQLAKFDRKIAVAEEQLADPERLTEVTIDVADPATLKKVPATEKVNLGQLEKAQAALLGEYQDKQMRMNFDKSEFMTVRWVYEESNYHLQQARQEGDKRLPHFEKDYAGALAGWEEIQKRTRDSKAAFDEVERKMTRIEDLILGLKKPLQELKAERGRLLKEREDRLLRLHREKPQAANAIRNAPMLDFFDPSIKVQQQIVPTILEDFNFAKVERVDRCATCHRGIDNPGYEVEIFRDREQEEDRYVFRDAHLKAFVAHARGKTPTTACEVCLGAGRGMIVTTAHGAWGSDEVVKFTKALMAHPHLELFAGPGSAHSIDKVGCTGCHEGDGRDTEFTRVVHMPDSEAQTKDWERRYHYHYRHLWDAPMLPRRHFYSSCRRCHNQEVELAGGDDKVKDGGWTSGNDYVRGMELYERAGCYACHRTDSYQILPKDTDPARNPKLDPNRRFRRPGPPLTHIKDKVGPDWAVKWVLAPKDFRLSTRMPHFFGQSNARTVVVDGSPVGPKKVESLVAGSMIKYLFETSSTRAYPPPPAPPAPPDVKRGQAVFEQIGCRACHSATPDSEYAKRKEIRNLDDAWRAPDGESWLAKERAPNLAGLASKFRDDPERGRAWIYHWVRKPDHYFADTRMPAFPLTEQQLHDVTAWLMTLKKEGDFDQRPGMPEFGDADHKILDTLIFEQLRTKLPDVDARTALEAMQGKRTEKVLWFGRRMVQNYGCYSCHEMTPEREDDPLTREKEEDPLLKRLPLTELPVNWTDIEGIGVELTGSQPEGNKAVDQLAFGYTHYDGKKHFGVRFEHPIHKAPYKHLEPENAEPELVKIGEFRHVWIRNKLLDPRVFDGGRLGSLPPDELLKMPNYYLNPEEVRLVTTFVLSLTNHDYPLNLVAQAKKRLTEDEVAINRGNRLIRENSCRACHRFSLERLEVEWEREEMAGSVKKRVRTFEWVEGMNSGQVAEDTAASLLTRWGIWPADPGPEHRRMKLYSFQWASDGCTLKVSGAINPDSRFVLVDGTRAEYINFETKDGKEVVTRRPIRRWRPTEGGEILPHIVAYKKAHNDDWKDSEGENVVDMDNPQAVFSRFPPFLRSQGAKTQSQWLFDFLKDPQPIRPSLHPIVPGGKGPPDLNIRMPDFGFSDEEAASLVRYFWARDRLAGEETHPMTSFPERDPAHFAERKGSLEKAVPWVRRICGECHFVEGLPPSGGATASYKFAPELGQVESRLRPRWLYPWLRQPALIYPNTPMTAMDYKEIGDGDQEKGLRAAVDYMMNWSRIPKPPAAPPPQEPPPPKKD